MSESVAPLAGLRCLVLDDEFLIALDIQTILESAGAASIVCAGSVEDAMTALADGPFDVAVLDLKLGGAARTSTAVAEELVKRKVPFVFLTGMRAGDKNLKRFPHVAVVEKPYQAELLLDAILAASGRA
ncbi:MAG: response regulator [Pseudolabrys sp.]|nr:response regulator [Pseudolabrys sp.]